MSTILGIEAPEDVRLKRQRGLVVLTPEAQAIADAALPRMERLRTCSIRAMTAMGHVLEAQGETDTPTLFDGWARLFFSKVASKREAAIQAFDAAMERWTQEAAVRKRSLPQEDLHDVPFQFGAVPRRPYPVGTIVYHWMAGSNYNQRAAVVHDDGGTFMKLRRDGGQGLCYDGIAEIWSDHVSVTPWTEDNPPVPYSSNFPARGCTYKSYMPSNLLGYEIWVDARPGVDAEYDGDLERARVLADDCERIRIKYSTPLNGDDAEERWLLRENVVSWTSTEADRLERCELERVTRQRARDARPFAAWAKEAEERKEEENLDRFAQAAAAFAAMDKEERERREDLAVQRVELDEQSKVKMAAVVVRAEAAAAPPPPPLPRIPRIGAFHPVNGANLTAPPPSPEDK